MTFESLPFEDRPIEIGRAALEEEEYALSLAHSLYLTPSLIHLFM